VAKEVSVVLTFVSCEVVQRIKVFLIGDLMLVIVSALAVS
jgi:hypothetical protein